MIVVRVELHSARTGQVTQLARMDLSNVGTSTDGRVGNYHGRVRRRPGFTQVTREGEVMGHRRRDLTVWTLLRKMLENMGY